MRKNFAPVIIYSKVNILYHIDIDTKCIGKEIMTKLIWFIISFAVYFGCLVYTEWIRKPQDKLNYYKKDCLKDNSMEKKIEENIIRKRALDEVSMRCKALSENGEITYFSLEDIDRIVGELKKE